MAVFLIGTCTAAILAGLIWCLWIEIKRNVRSRLALSQTRTALLSVCHTVENLVSLVEDDFDEGAEVLYNVARWRRVALQGALLPELK